MSQEDKAPEIVNGRFDNPVVDNLEKQGDIFAIGIGKLERLNLFPIITLKKLEHEKSNLSQYVNMVKYKNIFWRWFLKFGIKLSQQVSILIYVENDDIKEQVIDKEMIYVTSYCYSKYVILY